MFDEFVASGAVTGCESASSRGSIGSDWGVLDRYSYITLRRTSYVALVLSSTARHQEQPFQEVGTTTHQTEMAYIGYQISCAAPDPLQRVQGLLPFAVTHSLTHSFSDLKPTSDYWRLSRREAAGAGVGRPLPHGRCSNRGFMSSARAHQHWHFIRAPQHFSPRIALQHRDERECLRINGARFALHGLAAGRITHHHLTLSATPVMSSNLHTYQVLL